jgi:universal stress protein E
MSSSKPQILVAIDPEADEHPAAERACWLAPKLGARIELFSCRSATGAKALGPRDAAMRRDLQRLEALARAVVDAGVEVSVDVRYDDSLDEAIVRKTLETNPLLVAKSTQSHDTSKKTSFSNADWGLIRTCPVPLLLVKSERTAQSANVLAAIDPVHEHDKPVELDVAILAFAKRLSRACHSKLHVVHTFDPTAAMATSMNGMAALPPASPQLLEDVAKAVETEHRAALGNLLERVALDDYELHFARGNVREVLPPLAERVHAGFAVLGAVARGPIARLFLGSTAEQLLDRIPCDLVVIKPDDFKTPIARQSSHSAAR